METLAVTSNIQIPLDEFEWTFARSGGPGGQNVNKVNTKAVMRWKFQTSPSLSDEVKARFTERFGSRITVEGDVVMSSQKYRDQASNVQDCLDKLREMLDSVARRPIVRRETKPTLASKRRRVDAKRELSRRKEQRRAPSSFE